MLPALLSAVLCSCASLSRPWLGVGAGSTGPAWGQLWAACLGGERNHGEWTVLLHWHGKASSLLGTCRLCALLSPLHSHLQQRCLPFSREPSFGWWEGRAGVVLAALVSVLESPELCVFGN